MDATQEYRFDPAPPEEEVLRLLGYRARTMRLEPPMREVLAEARGAALPLLAARVVVRWIDDPSAFGEPGLFARVERLALGVATLGPALEEAAEARVAAGEWTLGLVLDAYGSAAVEAAVVEANAKICEEAERRGLVAGRRVSPGYARWPLEQQEALFAMFGGAPAGVALTEAFVMTPRKSVSFGVPLGRDLDAASPELGCRSCAMAGCAYRRHAAAEADAR